MKLTKAFNIYKSKPKHKGLISRYFLIAAFTFTFFVILNCTSSKSSSKQLRSKALGVNEVIVDVRTRKEFDSRHVEGSINIPLAELPTRHVELKTDKILLLCCVSGARSQKAYDILKSLGYKNITNAGNCIKFGQ